MLSGVVIDISSEVAVEPNVELTTKDINSWMNDHGPLPDRVVIFLLTGWRG